MSKMVKTMLWLLALVAFNAILYFIYIEPMKQLGAVPTLDEQAAKTMSRMTGGGVPQTGLEMKQLIIGKTPVLVEVAKTQEQERVGLMFRDSIGMQEGMLFVFDNEEIRNFWMQNTFMGLDLLYVGSDKDGSQIIKHIHNDAKKLDLTGLPSEVPVKYVIEVNDQFVEKFGIKVGDKVSGILD